MTEPRDKEVAERRLLPSDRDERHGRRRPWIVLLSLLLHALILALFVLLGRYRPVVEEPVEIVFRPPPRREVPPLVFSDQKVKIEEKKAPDTNVIADKNAVARSPGDEPPAPHGEDEMPRPEAAAPGAPGVTQPATEPTPEPEPEPPPESEPSEAPSQVPSFEEKRRRVAAALGGIGSSGGGGEWGDLAGEPSSGIGYSWGGGGMQIESRTDIDWGPWAEKVRQEVKDNWYSIMPVAARVGMKGAVVVHFRVQRDGTITDYEVRESTGTPPLDRAVDDALLRMSSPLPPLPLPPDSDEESIGITYMFTYNLDDERELRAWRRDNWRRKRSQQGG